MTGAAMDVQINESGGCIQPAAIDGPGVRSIAALWQNRGNPAVFDQNTAVFDAAAIHDFHVLNQCARHAQTTFLPP